MTLKADDLSKTLVSINSQTLSSSKLDPEQDKTDNQEQQEQGEAKELAEIQNIEKSVNIRFCNYSIIMRAQSFPSGISSQLLALLGGYGSMLLGGEQDKSKVLDASEEALLGKEPDEEADDGDNDDGPENGEGPATKTVILSKGKNENGKINGEKDYTEDW